MNHESLPRELSAEEVAILQVLETSPNQDVKGRISLAELGAVLGVGPDFWLSNNVAYTEAFNNLKKQGDIVNFPLNRVRFSSENEYNLTQEQLLAAQGIKPKK